MPLTRECQLVILQPQGNLDLEHSQAFKEQLASLILQPNDLWVIDLTHVDFMDSAGLSTLVTGLSIARSRGCRLVVCNLHAHIRIIFELTGLDLIFEIFESYNAVLTTVNSQQLNLGQTLPL
jgi:anti-anti-sigma factor